ncbi:CBM20 domain-containing protein [Pontibacter sp. CAU 1760]
MKKIIPLSIAFFLLCFQLLAQEVQTRITVKVPKATDEVYIVGNQPVFGNWNPAGVKMQHTSDLERSIQVKASFPAEFKFTKGSWASEGYTGDKRNNANLVLSEPDRASGI